MQRRVQLRRLDPLCFSHPLDLNARRAMEAVPLVPQIASTISGSINERFELHEQLSGALRVGPRQYPRLYRRFVEIAGVLDIETLPELFITSGSDVNAYAMGVQSHFVCVTGAMLDALNPNELDFILAHELGHIKCDHMKWRTVAHYLEILGAAGMGAMIQQVSGPLAGILAVGGAAALLAAQLAILEWSRKAEFTADRAGLLGAQNIDVAQAALSKLSTGTARYDEAIEVEALIEQAYALEEGVQQSFLMKMIHLQSLLRQTHPYIPIRIRDIRAWHAAGVPDRILAGEGRRWEFGETPFGDTGVATSPPPPPPAPSGWSPPSPPGPQA